MNNEVKAMEVKTREERKQAYQAIKNTRTVPSEGTMTKEVIDLTERLKARAEDCKVGYTFEPLSKADFDDGVRYHYSMYTKAIDDYQECLYDFSNGGKTTGKRLDGAFNTIMQMLGIERAKRDAIIKTMGNHTALVPKAYRRRLTAEKAEEVRALKAAIEQIKTREDIAELEKAKLITEKEEQIARIREGNNWQVPMFFQTGSAAFKKQIEQFIAYRLIDLDTGAEWKVNRTCSTNKWLRKLERAKKLGIAQKSIDEYKKNVDYDGLCAEIDKISAAKQKAVEAKAGLK